MTPLEIDWPAVVFDEKMMAHIDYAASRRFPSQGLAEEATTHIINHLSHDDWARCKKFQGSAKPETYLRVVISRALEDFSHKRFGKPRPPTWLKNQGQIWVKAWKMVCLERRLLELVKSSLSDDSHTFEDVDDIVKTIKARLPWCGEVTMEVPEKVDKEGETFSIDALGKTCSLSEFSNEQEKESCLLFLASILSGKQVIDNLDQITARPGLASYRKKLNNLELHLNLSAEERLLILLVYQEGKKFSDVARALNIEGHKPARMLKIANEKIASALSAVDLSVDHLREVFSEAE